MYIFAQIIGGIGIRIWVLSVLKKEKTKILIYQGVANIFLAAEFLLLHVYTPASMDIATSIRSFVFSCYTKKNKSIPIVWLFIFLCITIFFGIFTWTGFLGLIPVINTAMYVVTSWLKDTKWLRIFYVVAALFWIYYNFNVGAYAIIIGNIFEVITGTYAVIKYNKNGGK